MLLQSVERKKGVQKDKYGVCLVKTDTSETWQILKTTKKQNFAFIHIYNMSCFTLLLILVTSLGRIVQIATVM